SRKPETGDDEDHHAGRYLRPYRIAHQRQTCETSRVRRVRQDRRAVGPPADLPGMRGDALLRQLAESARDEARAGQRTSGDRVGRTRRTLAVLLSRRRLCGILIADRCSLFAFSRSRKTQTRPVVRMRRSPETRFEVSVWRSGGSATGDETLTGGPD